MHTTVAPSRAVLAGLALLVALALIVGLIGLQATAADETADGPAQAAAGGGIVTVYAKLHPQSARGLARAPGAEVGEAPVIRRSQGVPRLPYGGRKIFDGRMLVAYYGTAGTGALGVLGETSPAEAVRRVRRAARPFNRPGKPAAPVMELIVSVADPQPGADGDYSHDISRESVRRYVRAARKHKVLLVLDLQTGRSDFLTVAKRWKWALKDPWVGLALDPEWRMGPGEIPGRRIGSVSAGEINRTSHWLQRLTRRQRLPQKILMLHQFRREMVRGIQRVKSRPLLALVQHVDGFGTPQQKVATYHHVAQPKRFTMGFKLFYDEDTRLMSAATVKRIRPRVDFVSFQ